MRKNKYFLAAAVLTAGVLLAGCANGQGNSGTTQAGGVTPQYASEGNVSESVAQSSQSSEAADDGGEAQTSQQTQAASEAAQQTQVTPQTTQAATQAGESSAQDGVTEESAKSIALSDAGISEADVSGIRVKRDRDDGRDIYEVEFYVDREEYDYDIDASTGTILSKDYDIDNDFYGIDSQTDAGQDTDLISQDDAVNIVLSRIQGASAEDVWMEMDRDDGRVCYEGEVYFDNKEYEFQIDASTGDVIEWSEENIR